MQHAFVAMVLVSLLPSVMANAQSENEPAATEPAATQPVATLPAVQLNRPDLNPNLPTLFIAGDSTAHNPLKGQKGWGDVIGELFDRSRINFVNRAIGGRSSRTYQTEGHWDELLSFVKPGDFILIQFGTNDGGPLDDNFRARGSIRGVGDESRETYNPIMKKPEVVHTYGWYMRKYIADARAKGATPIIVDWIPHAPRAGTTWPTTNPAELTSYAQYARQVADSEHCDFVDLFGIVNKQFATMSPQEIKSKYYCEQDWTHTNESGAKLNAQAGVQGLRALADCKLKDYLASNASSEFDPSHPDR